MSASFEVVRQIAADLFRVPAEQISERSSPEDVAAWDSVQHLNLILQVELQFGVQFEPEELDGLKTIGQIAAAIDGRPAA